MKTINKGYFELVYKLVRKIPRGKVMTYGQISKFINTNYKLQNTITPQLVGWALHANKDRNTPCHRVVDRTGRLAPNFAFDGWKEQRRRLLEEGVGFIDERHVDIKRFVL